MCDICGTLVLEIWCRKLSSLYNNQSNLNE